MGSLWSLKGKNAQKLCFFAFFLSKMGKAQQTPSVRWTGSGNRQVVLDGRGDHVATVNFSNGSATVPWSSFRELPSE